MNLPFSFLTYFSHHQSILQLVGGKIADDLRKDIQNASALDEMLKKFYINRAFNDALVKYLLTHEVPPLQKLLIGNDAKQTGALFWMEHPILFKGAGKAWENCNYNDKRPSYFNFSIDFKEFKGTVVTGELNAEHLHTTSAVDQLSRKKTKFLLGYLQDVNGKTITVRTILIGDRVLHDDAMVLYEPTRSEIKIHQIDEFKKVKNIGYNDSSLDLNLNKHISESEIKKYFSEIIGETDIDKDWGGEQSDLFTTHLHVGGEQLRAAFVLKGPSKFHKMEMKDLGKNGDQIARLFDEPADIFILQHCHHIASSVVKTMDVFANQINRQRKYCIINGIDMQRIFKAYNKI